MAYDVKIGHADGDIAFRSQVTISDDNGVRSYRDGGEPEDNCFTRDYSWIEAELFAAYRQGKRDAMRKLQEFLAQTW